LFDPDLKLKKRFLMDPNNWISLEAFLKIIERFKRSYNDPKIMRAVGRMINKLNLFGSLSTIFYLLGNPETFVKKFPLYSTYLFKIYRFKLLYTTPNTAIIEETLSSEFTTAQKTKDLCMLLQGFFSSIPSLWGLADAKVHESHCVVSIQNLGIIDSKIYKVDLKNNVWEYDLISGIWEKEGRIIGTLNKDKSFRLKNTLYGSKSCIYRISWETDKTWYEEPFKSPSKRKILQRRLIEDLENQIRQLEKKYDEIRQLTLHLESEVKKRTVSLEKTCDELKSSYEKLKEEHFHASIHHKILGVRQFTSEILPIFTKPTKALIEGAKHIKSELRNIKSIEWLEKIIKDLLHAQNLIKHLTSVIHEKEFKKEVLHLAHLLADALEKTRKKFSFQNIQVIKELNFLLPPVEGDFEKLSEAFSNIIQNAIEAMPSGGTLKISAEIYKENSQNWIKVQFSDTGYGILEENIKRVFEPFFTTKESSANLGLGLTFSYAIISHHNGKVRLQSKLDEGTVLTVLLPPAKSLYT
jgi:anti-sigma regulatory factor (Ser/Thr protein kinase)